jgi:hypothetical protein
VWPWVCSICRNHNPVLSLFITYYSVCNKSNTMCTTSVTGTVSSSWSSGISPGFFGGVHIAQSLYLIFVSYFVDYCHFVFFSWPLALYFLYFVHGFWFKTYFDKHLYSKHFLINKINFTDQDIQDFRGFDWGNLFLFAIILSFNLPY